MGPPTRAIPTVVVVLVAGIVLLGLVTFLFGMQFLASLPPSGEAPSTISVNLVRSADGTNWVVTFTSAPSGLTASTTKLTILSPSGATILPWTIFANLNYFTDGVRYEPYNRSVVGAGDVLLVSFARYGPYGYVLEIADQLAMRYSGTLQ